MLGGYIRSNGFVLRFRHGLHLRYGFSSSVLHGKFHDDPAPCTEAPDQMRAITPKYLLCITLPQIPLKRFCQAF